MLNLIKTTVGKVLLVATVIVGSLVLLIFIEGSPGFVIVLVAIGWLAYLSTR